MAPFTHVDYISKEDDDSPGKLIGAPLTSKVCHKDVYIRLCIHVCVCVHFFDYTMVSISTPSFQFCACKQYTVYIYIIIMALKFRVT